MLIQQLFEKKKPVLSFEIFPPKKREALLEIDETLRTLAQLSPDFISVTFGAGGSSNNNQTVELAKKIKREYQIEPLVHLTCINHSKGEVDSILTQLKDAGIYHILALRGDLNPDLPIKKDFSYASDLASFIREKGDFQISGACYPEKHLEAPDMITDIHNLKKKVDAGVGHLISQLFFDNDHFYSFAEKLKIAGINVPVEAGIMPVTNRGQIEKMVSMCGASLPDKFIKILQKYDGNKEALFDAGMAYAINQIVELIAGGVDGIHVFTMNNPIIAKRICDGIRNLV